MVSSSPQKHNAPQKQRARSNTDKEARKQQLLNAARTLHRQRDLDWTMLEVAQTAKLAKGTTYLYFRTKEEVLLELLIQELGGWFEEFGSILEQSDPNTLAARIANSIATRDELVALFAVQASILERNITPEAAERFKYFLLEHSANLTPTLERAVPNLDGLKFLQLLNAVIIGIAQLAKPSSIVRNVLEKPELQALRLDFQPALQRTIQALLIGLTAPQTKESL
jgi:TetR/AcrR family transcriptional regulator